MADTVTFQTTVATPPDGTVILTDETATGHAQVVKLAIATDGSATLIPADANGLLVKSATAANMNVTEASAAAIAASLSVMDDWDETNRAAVNVIAGQVGIAGGTGVDGATVPRVTLATNVALPAGTNAIGKLAANAGVTIGAVEIAAAQTLATVTTVGTVSTITTLPAKKLTYAASAAQTQTNLDGLAASATHVAGWEGTAIDNSSNLYLDYIINVKIQVESSGLTAGEIRLYLVAELEDASWPDVFDGTESTETVTSVAIRDAICRLAAVTATSTDASRVYYLNCPSVATVFGGVVPRKFVPFITQSTVAALETTGDPNQVYVKGVYLT